MILSLVNYLGSWMPMTAKNAGGYVADQLSNLYKHEYPSQIDQQIAKTGIFAELISKIRDLDPSIVNSMFNNVYIIGLGSAIGTGIIYLHRIIEIRKAVTKVNTELGEPLNKSASIIGNLLAKLVPEFVKIRVPGTKENTASWAAWEKANKENPHANDRFVYKLYCVYYKEQMAQDNQATPSSLPLPNQPKFR